MVYHLPVDWSRSELERLSPPERNLILLPHLLSRICKDFPRGKTFNSLLRIVHKYPLSEYYYSKPDGLSLLYQQVIAAAKKYLGPYSRVSVRFYTLRIPLIRIPNCRYAAEGMANMKKQKRSSHRHLANVDELRPSNSRVALNKLVSRSLFFQRI